MYNIIEGEVGEGTKVWHFCHVMEGAKIGKNCTLGQNVFIGKNVTIGNGVKIQNNVSVYEHVTIEDDVFLGFSKNDINKKDAIALMEDNINKIVTAPNGEKYVLMDVKDNGTAYGATLVFYDWKNQRKVVLNNGGWDYEPEDSTPIESVS